MIFNGAASAGLSGIAPQIAMVPPSPSKSSNEIPEDELRGDRFQGNDAFDLLRTLTAVSLSAEAPDRIANWNLAAFDWDEFLSLAAHHGVLPMAARYLIEHISEIPSSGIPPEISRRLRSAYESNLQRSMWFAAELARITRHFEGRKLRVIPYKGPVLAQSLYGDLGMRSFSDLDFLISPADFEPARQALAELGYSPSTVFTAAVERMSLRTGYERSFDSAAGKHLVELQWALLPYFYAVGRSNGFGHSSESADNDLRVQDLLARSSTLVVGDCEVWCLSPEDSLLVSCVHAAKHLWSRLIWLADIAQTIRTQAIDYGVVSRRAHSLGIARMVGVSFWLAKNVLGESLHPTAETFIASDPRVEVMGWNFAARLARGEEYELESTAYFQLIFQLRERRRDRWRYGCRLVWTPSSGDLAAVQLPESLSSLYRIVRLGRLIRKLIRKFV